MKSRRILDMEYSPIRKLSGFVEIAKNKGVEVINMNIGQPDIHTPVEFKNRLKTFDENIIKYTDSRGLKGTLDAFISYYKTLNVDLEYEDMIITNGGSEGLLFTFISTCDNSDEIIVPSPFYSNYNNFADMANIKLIPVERKIEDNYKLPDVEIIKSYITSKTKAILIANPCNPTGKVYSKDELIQLLDLAHEHNLYLIIDEVYREFIYTESQPSCALNLNYNTDKIVIVDSISKRYSACGCRVGVVISKNKSLMDNMLKLAQSRLCVPVIEQHIASAVSEIPKSYIDEARNKYKERKEVLVKELNKIKGIKTSNPEGAFYLIAKLPIKDSEHFAKWMITHFNYNNKTVLVSPADKFYKIDGKGKDEIRLSYCIEKEKLMEATKILQEGLLKYKEDYE